MRLLVRDTLPRSALTSQKFFLPSVTSAEILRLRDTKTKKKRPCELTDYWFEAMDQFSGFLGGFLQIVVYSEVFDFFRS